MALDNVEDTVTCNWMVMGNKCNDGEKEFDTGGNWKSSDGLTIGGVIWDAFLVPTGDEDDVLSEVFEEISSLLDS